MARQLLKTLAGASLLVLLLNVAAKGIGFLKELVFAGVFGVSGSFEVLLSAGVFSTIINTSIYYFTANYFIPAYNRIQSQSGTSAGKDFISTGFWLYLAGALLLAGFFYVLAPAYTAVYFAPESSPHFAVFVSIFRWYLLSIPLNAVAGVLTAFTLANFRYGVAIAAQVVPNLSVIIAALLFGNSVGVMVIPISYVIGSLLWYTILHVRTPGIISLKSFSPASFLLMHGTGLVYTMLIEIIGQFYILADRGFLAQLPVGGIASLNYAFVLFMMPVAVFTMTLNTVFFPKFAEGIQKSDKTTVSKYLMMLTGLNIIFFLPVQVAFMLFNRETVTLFFARGGFGESAVALTSQALFWYGISISCYGVYSACNRFIYSAGSVKFLFWLTISVIVAKYGLNVALAGTYGQNGLAFATSVCYVVFCVASLLYIRYRLGIRGWRAAATEVITAFIPVTAAYIVARCIQSLGIAVISEPFSVLAIFALAYLFLLHQSGSTAHRMALNRGAEMLASLKLHRAAKI